VNRLSTDPATQTTLPEATPTLWVRDVPIYGDAILSPMDGYSDWPFRSLCRELGSAVSYTEFIQIELILQGHKGVFKRLTYHEDERPLAFQIYGEDPDLVLKAALQVQELKPDFIDINMGCPAKSVAHRGAGVGLMRSPLKVARIFKKLSAALDVPVTGKIRLGWDDCQSYKLIARIVEENGGSLVAIHGRTKEQRYGGQADWDAIADVCAAVNIPVIGNGDIKRVADIERMKQYTGCQAVMIGRGAISNPWIFSGLDREQVPQEQVRQFMRRHLDRNIQFYGEEDGQRLFRKYVAQYLGMKALTREERRNILSQRPREEFLSLLDEVAATLAEVKA
jgi:tRNA-dihydrouridine synthase B